jgi:eukaryotic-like serine/threonine-protein kinase
MHLERNTIIGEYRIVDFLGEGGMGQVYRAVHSRIGRTVAIKILNQTSESVIVQRFLNEARIQASLRHPGIAALYDFIEERGRSVIIMEYVDGETVQEITSRNGAWSAVRALPVLRSCAATLAYVHSQGVVHRDLKSANLKITSAGETKLLDFGIATAQMVSRLTTQGFVIGTFQSLSPEQARGELARPASDIWAFGVLAYEMLTASLPFEGATQMELFSKIMKASYTPPAVLKPGIPADLERVIVRCLRKNPVDRYPSMDALIVDLDAAASRIGSPLRNRPAISRRGLIGTAAAILLLMVALMVLSHISGNFSGTYSSQAVSQSDAVPSNSSSTSTLNPPEQGDLKRVTIDVPDGVAEVWEDGKLVGQTPFVVTKPYGDAVKLVLHQPGYDDMAVQFEVSQRSEYIYLMHRSDSQR